MSDSLQIPPNVTTPPMAAVAAAGLLTAEQYGELPDLGFPSELVRGRIVPMNQPYPRHGEICAEIARLVANHAKQNQLGRVTTNDSGIITERSPDTVRGADVAYYSYERVAKGPLPRRKYLEVVPELVFEVRSPSDRWSEILAKVAEYLKAGVQIVCIVDEETETVEIRSPDRPAQVLSRDDELAFNQILPGFGVVLRQLFE